VKWYFKTVLVQDHFYSFYLLFAPANKTLTESRMINHTLPAGNGISTTGSNTCRRITTVRIPHQYSWGLEWLWLDTQSIKRILLIIPFSKYTHPNKLLFSNQSFTKNNFNYIFNIILSIMLLYKLNKRTFAINLIKCKA
jgi:hypothetical protein